MKKTVVTIGAALVAMTLGALWVLSMWSRPDTTDAPDTGQFNAISARSPEAATTSRQLDNIGVVDRAIVESTSPLNSLEIRVQDASGMPISEATVALVPDTRPLGVDQVAFRTTDAYGVAKIGVVTGKGERTWHVLVAATGRIPSWEPFVPPSEGGRMAVTLGESGRIEGVVRIAGRSEDLGAERDELPRSLFLAGSSRDPLSDMPRGLQQRLRELGYTWLNKAQARVDPAHVAGAEPATPRLLPGRLGIAEVLHRRVFPADGTGADFADHTRSTLVVIVVEDLHLVDGHRLAE